jgi:hypothetical protein
MPSTPMTITFFPAAAALAVEWERLQAVAQARVAIIRTAGMVADLIMKRT